MSDILIRSSFTGDAHWAYDDPSGFNEAPLAVQLPDALRPDVERAAAHEGMSPSQWLLSLVSRSLLPTAIRPL